ncbi:hypothetical protein EJB05_57462, partial [Eragrostis curvula]
MPPAVASRFMGSQSQVKQNPHRLDPEAQMRRTRGQNAGVQEGNEREEMKLLGEEFNDALKKANEEVRITKEFLRVSVPLEDETEQSTIYV